MGILSKVFGDESSKFIKSSEKIVAKINALEADISKLADVEFPKKTQEFKERIASGEALDDILPEAFALVREAAKRNLGERPYDVQLVGGIALHQGKIAEMKTGEGKTLVATLPLYLNALLGRGAHLVTVNDYLARLQGSWMGKIYHYLGLTTGVIGHAASYLFDLKAKKPKRISEKAEGVVLDVENLIPVSRKEAYAADITYGTNNEYGFDYLRDNMALDITQLAQRPLQYAIVDEVDSILIDEARTPLIISAPDTESTSRYKQFSRVVEKLEENTDYNVDE